MKKEKLLRRGLKPFGCAIASASYAASKLEGMQASEAQKISNVIACWVFPPVKLHCSMLAQDAIEAALKDLKRKQRISTEEEPEKLLCNALE